MMKEIKEVKDQGKLADLIISSKKLTEDERAQMIAAVSCMQGAVKAMEASVAADRGAVLLVCGIGEVSGTVALGSCEVMHDALVQLGRADGMNREVFGSLLMHAALEIAPELKDDILKAIRN